MKKIIFLFSLMILLATSAVNAQDYRLGIYASPMISWFSPDVSEINNEGARAGFSFSFMYEKMFTDNYSLVTGANLISSGGRLAGSERFTFEFPSFTRQIGADTTIVYRIQYFSVPVGLKLKTNELGYLTYFADFGLDPKMAVRGRVDIPAIDIEGERAMSEIKRFNMGWHLDVGIEYALGLETSAILGLGFENNFFDVTKDNRDQPKDKTSQKMLKFIFGVNF